MHAILVRAALRDLQDSFQFEVGAPTSESELRFHVQVLINGRPFEDFCVDVGSGDPVIEPPEQLVAPALLQFALISPAMVPCYPLTQQIAEKVHAYTRPRHGGANSRVKDWVDILLIAELGTINSEMLVRALRETFRTRATHSLPMKLPDPPSNWATEFRRMAREVRLGYKSIADAKVAITQFLDPVLQQEISGTWNPITWSWV